MRKFLSLSAFALLAALLVQPALAKDAPDLSTPKATAVTFSKALLANDIATLKSACVGSEEELKAVETMANALASMRRFKAACTAKWGKDNALSGHMPGDPDLVAEAEKSEFKIDGDTAKEVAKEGKPASELASLKKVDGVWKVDLKSMSASLLPQAKLMDKFIKAFNDSATEIESGKYSSLEEAAKVIGPRMENLSK